MALDGDEWSASGPQPL